MRKEPLMKFASILFPMLLIFSSIHSQNNSTTSVPADDKQKEKAPLTFAQQIALEDKESVNRILSTFALMLKNFFNIAKDPHDPTVLGPNLVEMATGLIAIAMEMFKKNPLIDEQMQEVTVTTNDEDMQLIKEIKQLLIEYGSKLETIAQERDQ